MAFIRQLAMKNIFNGKLAFSATFWLVLLGVTDWQRFDAALRNVRLCGHKSGAWQGQEEIHKNTSDSMDILIILCVLAG